MGVDRIKVKVRRRTVVFDKAFSEVVSSILSDCIIEMDSVSHWGTFSYLIQKILNVLL